jgi:hypothetical protein
MENKDPTKRVNITKLLPRAWLASPTPASTPPTGPTRASLTQVRQCRDYATNGVLA